MSEPRRETALVTKKYLEAFELDRYLRAQGIDSRIDQGYAVRVLPGQATAAETAMKAYHYNWRGDGRYNDAEEINWGL